MSMKLKLPETATLLRKFAAEGPSPWTPQYVKWLATQLEEGDWLSPNHEHDLLHVIDDASYLLD